MPFLEWVNKNQAVNAAAEVPYHLLELVNTYGDPQAAQNNLIIQGDNLQALKALLPFYTGKIKCIFIDPPYNTQSAFEHYDDKLEHSQWLSLIYPRLMLLRDLLAEDGSLWITIDDNEAHYLKVLCDEIFGRNCFITNIAWRTSDSSNNNVTKFSLDHNEILVYGKNSSWQPKFLDIPDKRKHFKNPDNDPKGPWFDGNNMQNPGLRPNLQFNVIAPNGNVIKHPPNGWRWSKETIDEKMKTGEIRFSEDGTRLIRRTYLADMTGLPPSSLWVDLDETGHNRQAKYELKNLQPDTAVTNLFTTPKPEKLIQKILLLATNPNDIVLDSFLGSGTTAAVAHKMNRRYVGIEMGDHARTHCIPRLQKVVEGEQGGISKAIMWNGGGGFGFYTLGEAVFDADGHISTDVRFDALAAYIWLLETKTAITPKALQSNTPFIGEYEGVAYYLLYNGILGDRRPNGGNVLTSQVLAYLDTVYSHTGPKVIFGEASRISETKLNILGISFKQIPYELHERV